MKRLFTIALALGALTPLTAQAQERMTDARYISAQRCLAYSELQQLQADGLDFTALREAADVGARDGSIISRTRETARQVRSSARWLAQSERGLSELRTRRDDACARFVERGLVQHGATSGAGAP